MTSVSTPRGVPWQTAVLAIACVALVAWFLHGIDRHALGRALARARPGLIAAAALVTLQTYVWRAWRWQALLAPLGGASFRNSFRVTVMGFTATNVLPGRLGEILRPYLIARVEPVSAPAAFATVLIERLLDVATVTLLFGVFLVTSPIDVGRDVTGAGLVAAAVALVGLVAMACGARRPGTLRQWADAIAGRLPLRVAARVRGFAHTLIDGLAALRRPRHVAVAAFMSLGMWLSIAAGVWLASRALDLTMAFPSSFLVVMFLVVGVAVPVPAGVGSFHSMYQLAATSFLGANREQAAAAAILLHAVTVVPISLLGLAYLAQDGWTLARLRDVRPDGGPEARRRKL
jgi:uncharacterized protein (TIRG00374 family)